MEKRESEFKKKTDFFFWVSLGVFCLSEAEGIRGNFPVLKYLKAGEENIKMRAVKSCGEAGDEQKITQIWAPSSMR